MHLEKSVLEACLWPEELPERATDHLMPIKITAAKTNGNNNNKTPEYNVDRNVEKLKHRVQFVKM